MTTLSLQIFRASGLTAASADAGKGSPFFPALEHSLPPFQYLDLSGEQTPVAALPADADARLNHFVAEHGLKRTDRAAQLAILATHDLITQLSASESAELRKKRTAVIVASSRGCTHALEENHRQFLECGETSPFSSPRTTMGSLSSILSQHFSFSGPSAALSTACTSSFAALSYAAGLLATKQCQYCLVVGCEAALTPFTGAQMRALGVQSTPNRDGEPPRHPCQPLAATSPSNSGMVLGEGAAALLIAAGSPPPSSDDRPFGEPLATILALESLVERTPSPTAISPDGRGFQDAMRAVLRAGEIQAPDLILAHAPGTAMGDRCEQHAIHEVFQGKPPALYSPKWCIGHTFGASGALNVLLALELFGGAPLPRLPYSSSANAKLPLPGGAVGTVLINTAGFGGLISSVLLHRGGA
ncbi:hypothetical protein MRY87_13275 [bacterium]|nr:hypothetical protein [bacterium]